MKKIVFFLLSLTLFFQGCSPYTNEIITVSNIQLIKLDSPTVDIEVNQLLELTNYRTSFDLYEINLWYYSPVVRWNQLTREWVKLYYRNPVVASRAYAMMSVAQQRALDKVNSFALDNQSRLPNIINNEISVVDIGCKPFECGALIGSAERMLLYLFPETQDQILVQVNEARRALLVSGNILPSDLDIAESIGRDIAESIIAERMNDGSASAAKSDPLPVGDEIWKPDPFQKTPQAPGWGKVIPWLMTSTDQFRSAPPPAFGSHEFQLALIEVHEVQMNITPEQMEIADYWSADPGTVTPPGMWNIIAADLIGQYKLSSVDASHVFATINMAMMDAGIGCWDAKYYYLVVRPWQANSEIDGLVGYPNHPSYPSGHSCFSSAGAEVLSLFFPKEKEHLYEMAKEASMSRLYGGIHYRFDLDAGLELGKHAGELANQFAIEQSWVDVIK